MAEVEGNTNYRDPTPIPDVQEYSEDNIDSIALQIASFIREKMYGVDVRESLARWVEINLAVSNYLKKDQTDFKADLTQLQAAVTGRQTEVEKRQTDVETKFKQVLADATQDSEVINARNSTLFGDYDILDGRFENIEQLLSMVVAAGFTLTINHNLGRTPTITAEYYEYAIGTEPSGLGTGPAGTFGGTPAEMLNVKITTVDANNTKIDLPSAYKMNGILTYQSSDHCYYLINDYKVIKFDLGITPTDSPNTADQTINVVESDA